LGDKSVFEFVLDTGLRRYDELNQRFLGD
jgi:hypothetical protein